ncbi:TPA: RDD family protein [Pseudomonas aeruginosa]|nr:RDD family protein [Pseudomonas aeruginosa]HBO4010642.1 RDD family protein [Pseudomonas aeruginosa]
MKSFLLASFKKRLKVISALSMLLLLAWYSLAYLTAIESWEAQKADAIKWISGQKEQCQTLFKQAEEEIESIDKGRCELKGDLSAFFQCRDSEKKRKAELVQTIWESDCPVVLIPGARSPSGLPLLSEKRVPDPIAIYAIKSRGLSLPTLAAAFAGLFAALMLISDFTNRLMTESNPGWKRLSIVGSLIAAGIVAGLWLYEGESGEKTFLASIMAFCISYFALVYSRTAYKWVADGFSTEKTMTLDTNPIEELTAKTIDEPIEIASDAQNRNAEDNGEPTSAPISAAKFWPRLWARCIDLTLCWFLGSLAASFPPDLRSAFPGIGGVIADLLVGMAFICGAVFIYEWQFVWRLGGTPGKLLFGISVSSIDGGRPSSDAARVRAWIFLKSGLYFCFYIPILQILGAISAWRRKEGTQPWDMAARTFTGQRPIGSARYFCIVFLAVCMIALMVGISKAAKEITMEDIRRSSLN